MIIGTPLHMAIMASQPKGLDSYGSLLSHADGATGTISSNEYDDLTDQGSLGGTYDYDAAKPDEKTVGGISVPHFESTEKLKHSAAASNFVLLHDSSSDATLIIRAYIDSVTNPQRFFATYDTSHSNIGLATFVSGSAIQTWVGNGTGSPGAQITTSSVTLTGAEWLTIRIKKSGNTVSQSVNRESFVSDTISSASSSDPEFTAVLGNKNAGDKPMLGALGTMALYDVLLSDAVIDEVSAELEARWSGTPA